MHNKNLLVLTRSEDQANTASDVQQHMTYYAVSLLLNKKLSQNEEAV